MGAVAGGYGLFLWESCAAGRRAPPATPRRTLGQLFLVGGVVTLSLFWTATTFAAAYGEGRALDIAESLDERPAVVLDVRERLWLPEGTVEETALVPEGADPAAAYRFRYRGLRLLVHAGDRMFLVPQDWAPGNATTLVVTLDGGARIQFAP